MTSFSFTKNFSPNTADLGIEQKVDGWLATHRTFLPVGDVSVAFPGWVRGRTNEKREVNTPITSTLTLPGGVKGTFDKGTVFTDFAHYAAASTIDPAVTIVKAKTSGAAYDAAATGGFRRVSMSLTVPSASSTQRRAAYVAPGVRVNGMAQNNGVNIDAVQVEVAANGATTPSTYEPARALQVGVRPNRLNFASNPSWRSATTTSTIRTNLGWSKSTTSWAVGNPAGGAFGAPTVVSTGAPDDNGDFLRATVTTAATAPSGGWLFGAPNATVVPTTPGLNYSVRFMVRTSTAKTVYAMIRYYDGVGAQVGGNTQLTGNISVPANTWTEIVIPTAAAPTGAVRGYVNCYQTAGANWVVGDTFDVAGLIIEQAGSNLPWFDGSTAAANGLTYSWNGTAGASSSKAVGPAFVTAPFLPYNVVKGWQVSPGVLRLWSTNGVSSNIWGFTATGTGTATTEPGAYWTLRYKVRQVGGSAPVTLQPRIGYYNAAGNSLATNGITLQPTTLAVDSPWTEIVCTSDAPAPSGSATARVLVYQTATAPNATVLEFKECLLERVSGSGQQPGPYFDGSSGSDYLWEAGTAADVSRSYYYEDFAVRSYLLKQVLAENCPLGVIPAVPQFAVQPRF